MRRHPYSQLLAAQATAGKAYLEFRRTRVMSLGLYVLPTGGVDQQQPHAEDEVYVVVAGLARFTAGDETQDVAPGDVVYVEAGVAHRFHDITEDLELIVVFAPPES